MSSSEKHFRYPLQVSLSKNLFFFSCVALMPDVDSEVSLGSSDEAARLVSNGRQVNTDL